MDYYLSSYAVKGLILDDAKKEIRIVTDINVGITEDVHGLIAPNSSIEFVIKGFSGYDEFASFVKEAVNNWVKENYPST